jgi:hypothetical protein
MLAARPSDPVPACLRQENPNRLVTVLDMLRFQASSFVAISGNLGQAIMDIKSGSIPHDHTMEVIATACGTLMRHCEEMELPLSHAHLKRTFDRLHPGMHIQEIGRALEEVQQRVWDELNSRTCFVLPERDAGYYQNSQFPPAIFDRFPDATFDAEEAGKCLALDRPTACVFHLMRVTEYGLQAVGKLLKMKDPRPNWEPIIAKIDAELKKPYAEREFKGNADTLAHISAHFNAVKLAWRNRAMHVDRKHTTEEAREIYTATCGLMRYLAESLPKESAMVRTIRGIIGS